MSAGKKTRAARSPRASTPNAARPWYAPKPRYYVAAIGCARVMRHTDQPFVVQKVATCDSLYQARQLARALNREEKYARWRREDLERLKEVSDFGFACRGALRRLVDAGARVPVLRDGGAFAKALAEARRVLGDEPTFAPGGEEVAR